VGGGLWGIFYCYVLSRKHKGKLDVGIFTNCILGGLVSITAICAICRPWEALLIGMFGGFIVSYGKYLTLVHARHDIHVACKAIAHRTGKIDSLDLLKEVKICYKIIRYTLCLGSVNRQKSRWKVLEFKQTKN